MSESKYPLIEQLGLTALSAKPLGADSYVYRDVVLASDLERVLEQAVKVTKQDEKFTAYWNEPDVKGANPENSTHTALLINIQPIVKDTAESLLRDLIHFEDKSRLHPEFIARARRLLEGK